MRRWWLAGAVALAGCGGGGGTLPDAASPGAKVADRAGCTSCHRIGTAGNSGPGLALTHIGARKSREQIREYLLHPPKGMPAYDTLSKADLGAVLDYLSARR